MDHVVIIFASASTEVTGLDSDGVAEDLGIREMVIKIEA